MKNKIEQTYLGYGLGLRPPHIEYVLENQPSVDWFEILSDNYLGTNNPRLKQIKQIREKYPLVMHGVGLSLGNTDPLNQDYLKQLKQLASEIKPAWISDHLCWTGVEQKHLHDLLPLPYTEESMLHVIERIKQVQDFLDTQILIENVSSYITYEISEMFEWDFLTNIAEQADCLILLDINNIYVSAYNHQFDPQLYLNAMPAERVQQFHLAGHDNQISYILDNHGSEIALPVWELYELAIKRFNNVSVLIERDENIPEFSELFEELMCAKKIAHTLKHEPADVIT